MQPHASMTAGFGIFFDATAFAATAASFGGGAEDELAASS